MKYKMLALVLALTVVSWAQTATPASPSTQEQSAPTDKKGSCCDKADAKDAHACCAHHDMKDKSGKEVASCGGKDAKSCTRKSDDKTAASCCKDSCSKDKTASACCGGDCGKEGDKGCCSKKGDKTAKSCCNHELKG